jgi:hypothetical protein
LTRNEWHAAHARYLFAVHALSKVFRGKFLDGMHQLFDKQQLVFPDGVTTVAPLSGDATFREWCARLRRQPWVVYSKAPFAGPEKLLNYLGHYTHRVAISNTRLLSCDDGQVVFHYRDRAAGDIRKTMSLPADEFLRRFLCHVLPKGFQRIRHYGLLASRSKGELLPRCRELLGAIEPDPPVKKTTAEWIQLVLNIDVSRCPRCGQAGLQRTELPPVPSYRACQRPAHGAPHSMLVAGHDTS